MTYTNLRYFNGHAFVAGDLAVAGGKFDDADDGQRVDLQGGYVVPAFNDCHCHVSTLAEGFSHVEVGPQACPTLPDVLAALRDAPRTGDWLIGKGFIQGLIPERRYPTLAELDAAVPDRPCYVWHASRHGLVANSKALAAAGIGPQTDDPDGGRIERDERGHPTGVLLENAIGLLRRVTPPMTKEEMADNLLLAAAHLHSMGITAATDMSSFRLGMDEELWAYERAWERGMKLRVRLTPVYEALDEPFALDDIRPVGCEIGGVKLFADGAIGTRTAAITGEFLSGGSGMLIHPQEELNRRVASIHAAGRQAVIHAIGDRAAAAALDAIEVAQGGEPSDRRHRIDHSMLLDDGLIARYSHLHVCAALQPEFMLRFGDDYFRALGDRATRIKPYRSLVAARVPIGFSSDLTIVPGNPADGLLAAVQRRSQTGTQFDPSEVLTPAEAIRAYTQGSAYLGFQENSLGVIAPGYAADFVMYDADPVEILRDGGRPEPVATYVAGDRVWSG